MNKKVIKKKYSFKHEECKQKQNYKTDKHSSKL